MCKEMCPITFLLNQLMVKLEIRLLYLSPIQVVQNLINLIIINNNKGPAVGLDEDHDLESRIWRMVAPDGPQMEDIGLLHSKLLIHNSPNINESNTMLIRLQ
jgi:hypothetical protein